jgi:hypothetical protein
MLLLLRKYASTYIHSFPSPDSPKIILLLTRERIAKNIIPFLLFPVKLMLKSFLLPLAIFSKEGDCSKKIYKYEEIKRSKCSEPRRKKK